MAYYTLTDIKVNGKPVFVKRMATGYIYCPAVNAAMKQPGIKGATKKRNMCNNKLEFDLKIPEITTAAFEGMKRSLRQTCANCKICEKTYE